MVFTGLILGFLVINKSSAEEKPAKYDQKTVSYKDIQLFAKALSILQSVSMNKQNSTTFVYAAMQAMAEALDRYSFFVPPALMGSFIEGSKDKYAGIGIHIAKTEDGNLEILSTVPTGPAFKAGIKPKDKIISIDGTPVNKMPLIEAIKLLRNPGLSAGSIVTLSILRNGNARPIDFVLVREFIKPQVLEWKILDRGYGYTRITLFNKSTVPDFQEAIQTLETEGGSLKGLVIDLRNNPGGEMEAATELSRLFIGSGAIASLDSNFPEYKVKFTANRERFYEWPVVIIVDEGSASAAELFSGALQFNKRAQLIGRRTYGKGTFQSLITLSSDTALYITLGKFYMPDGSSLEGSGLRPDVMVDQDVNEEVMINRALQMVKSIK